MQLFVLLLFVQAFFLLELFFTDILLVFFCINKRINAFESLICVFTIEAYVLVFLSFVWLFVWNDFFSSTCLKSYTISYSWNMTMRIRFHRSVCILLCCIESIYTNGNPEIIFKIKSSLHCIFVNLFSTVRKSLSVCMHLHLLLLLFYFILSRSYLFTAIKLYALSSFITIFLWFIRNVVSHVQIYYIWYLIWPKKYC